MKQIKNSDFQTLNYVKIFKNQIFEEISQEAIYSGQKFIDPEFSPHNKILSSKNYEINIPWNRPIVIKSIKNLNKYSFIFVLIIDVNAFKEISKRPFLLKEGPECCTNIINSVNNMTRFIAVCGALSRQPFYINQIIPNFKEQRSKYEENFENDPGAFHFYFWKFGTIWDVTIDDLLPVVKKKPLYSYADDENTNEFWISLLEKAYAKFNNSDFESLDKQTIPDILVDLTSGLYEPIIELQKYLSATEKYETLTDKLRSSLITKTLVILSKEVTHLVDNFEENRLNVNEIGYTLTNIIKIKLLPEHRPLSQVDEFWMVRLFSPWKEVNYNGPWSKNSIEWKYLTDSDKFTYNLSLESSHEFWMPLDIALKYFNRIDILHHQASMFYEEEINKEGNTYVQKNPCYGISYLHKWNVDDKIMEKNRAGSATNEQFLFNPQYIFDVKSLPTIIRFSLQQERYRFKSESLKNIVFYVLKIENNRVYRSHIFYDNIIIRKPLGKYRNVFLEFEAIDTGRYLFIPCTIKGYHSAEYLLRVYSNKNVNFRLVEHDTPNELFPNNILLCTKYRLGTVIIINKIELDNEEFKAFGDEMMIEIVVCGENMKCVKRAIVSSNLIQLPCPFSVILYRRNINESISIKVYGIKHRKKLIGKIKFYNNDSCNTNIPLQQYLYKFGKNHQITILKSKLSLLIYTKEILMKI